MICMSAALVDVLYRRAGTTSEPSRSRAGNRTVTIGVMVEDELAGYLISYQTHRSVAETGSIIKGLRHPSEGS